MSVIRRYSRLILVAVSCATIGAGASAIASAGAATPGPGNTAQAHVGLRNGLGRLARRSVHGEVVVKTKTGFVTVTFDRGKIDSVDGQRLTINEGTRGATYKTVTLTVPADARVRDDRQKSTLSALRPGQRVIVLQGPRRTLVIAHTPNRGRGAPW